MGFDSLSPIAEASGWNIGVTCLCYHRITVSTSPFHGENRGSIPRGSTIYLIIFLKPNLTMADNAVAEEPKQEEGLFRSSLKRNNKQIRDDRADGISEDAQLGYQRKIQDLRMEHKRLTRQRNNMLDLSPTNAQSLMLGEDFNSTKFVDDDIKIGVELRNLDIKIEIAEARYKILFGELNF